jgi:hypothetical protein
MYQTATGKEDRLSTGESPGYEMQQERRISIDCAAFVFAVRHLVAAAK